MQEMETKHIPRRFENCHRKHVCLLASERSLTAFYLILPDMLGFVPVVALKK